MFPPGGLTMPNLVLHFLAHGFGGTTGLPIPRWLLAYCVGFAVVITFLVLRVAVPDPRRLTFRVPTVSNTPSPRSLAITRSIGLLVFVGTLVAAAIGLDDSAANIAPVTVIVMFWLGLQAVCIIAGDVYWRFDPFAAIAAVTPEPSGRKSTVDEHWTAAVLLFAFVWYVLAYPEFYPPTPHETAWFLAAYTVAIVAGITRWGREWVKEGEAFGALFGLLGRRNQRPATTGTVALLSVYLGTIVFDAASQTNWWIDVLGTSRGWNERLINTVGLVWGVCAVAVVFVLCAFVVSKFSGVPTADVMTRFAPMLVPLGAAFSVTHYFTAFLADVQNFVALLSDPLGRGWDLFHTVDNIIDYRWLTPTQTEVVQVIVLLAGCVGGAFVVHRVALTRFRGTAAIRAIYPFATALILAAVGAVALLLGT